MNGIYLLVICYSLLLKMVREIVDLPIENGGSFHSYVKLPEGISLSMMYIFRKKYLPHRAVRGAEFYGYFMVFLELSHLLWDGCNLVGALEPWNFMTFHILGRIIPTDKVTFFRGVETTNQLSIMYIYVYHLVI